MYKEHIDQKVFDTVDHNPPAAMQVNVRINVVNGVIQTYLSP
jgi:hypothetical protein